MATVQEIFDMAIDLMDERDETTGSTNTADTREYILRTFSILNSGIQVLAPYSLNNEPCSFEKRPFAPFISTRDPQNPDFKTNIPLDDSLAYGLLPFYLASLLKSSEDTEFSGRMMTEFNNALQAIRDKTFAEFEDIVPAYGLF